ncbi:hypothetical protein PVAG01_02221 [Phlyctema vagabunda]|uniref:Azaphilone pigments biosynthesis cluster protein L N-terminal domain-containing protein n=1 Tax=Phlyctema vagabunda TaxID=108571 RepID=A0ABR4PQ39_9HELO
MAELLGVVASSIAVGQLTAEIVKGISKLRSLVRHAQDAPRNIQDTLEEMEMMGQLLQEFQLQSATDNSSSSSILIHKCIDKCKQVTTDINVIVTRLDVGLKGGKSLRRWSAIKAALKNDDLEDLQRSLGHAKSMLSLAIDCFQMAQDEKRKKALDQLLKVVVTETDVSVTGWRPPSTHKHKHQPGRLQTIRAATNHSWWGLGNYITKTQTKRYVDEYGCEQDEHLHEYCYFPSHHLSRLAFQISASNSKGAWKYSLTPIRIVPSNSPVFRACWRGDTMEMARLISSGQATIRDSTLNGSSLLHIAAMRKWPKAANWLIRNGADSSCTDIYGETPLYRALDTLPGVDQKTQFWLDGETEFWPPILPDPNKGMRSQMGITKALIELGQSDPLARSIRGHLFIANPIGLIMGNLINFEYFFEKQREILLESEIHQVAWEVFESYAVFDCLLDAGTLLSMIKILFGPNGIPSKHCNRPIRDRIFKERGTLFTYLVTILAETLFENIGLFPVIEDLVRAGAKLHVANRHGATCLDVILSIWGCWGFEDTRQDLVFLWLRCLHMAGINLTDYLLAEQSVHHEGRIVPIDYYRPGVERRFEIEYGSRPDEVIIHVWDSFIENKYAVPGGWDSENEFAEVASLQLCSDDKIVLIDCTVSTAGFARHDYSRETAGVLRAIKL